MAEKSKPQSVADVTYKSQSKTKLQQQIMSFGFSSEQLRNLQKAAGIMKSASKMTEDDLQKLYNQAVKLEDQLYKKKSLHEKLQYQQQLKAAQEAKLAELKALDEIAAKNNAKLHKEYQEKITAIENEISRRKSLEQDFINYIKKSNNATAADKKAVLILEQSNLKAKTEEKQIELDLLTSGKAAKKEQAERLKVEQSIKKEELDSLETQKKAAKTAEERAKLEDEIKDKKKEIKSISEDIAKSEQESKTAEDKEAESKQKRGQYAALGKQIGREITDYMNQFGDFTTTILTNLQGTNKNLYNILPQIQAAAAISPFTTQMEVLQNLANLTDAGLVYNVEQRAFLEAIASKIATTFDVANGTLLRLIRIQQQDSTKQRMALEASLTEFLNNMFEDSTYMRDNFDTVSSTIIDAVSQLGRDQGFEFEYVVQKWLGALQSIGLSSETIGMIARAINMLGTGDVTGIAGNSGIQTLLAMSTNGNYANILTQGLNSTTANTVISNMVSYLKSVSTNDNQVIRSQYANMFGLSMADMNAIMNLDNDTLAAVSDSLLSFSDATEKFNQLYSTMMARTHVAEIVSNIKDNVMQTASIGLAGNPVMATLWQLLDTADRLIDTDIPAIQAFGSGVNLENSIVGLAKLGMAGIGLFLGGINTVAGALSNGGVGINAFNASDSTRRGSGFTGILGATTDDSAAISYKQSGSTEDFESQTLAEGAKDADRKSGIVNDQIEKEKLVVKENYDFEGLGYLQKLVEGDNLETAPLSVNLIGFAENAQTQLKNKVLSAIKEGAIDDLNRSLATGSGWSVEDEDFTLLDVMVMLYRVLKAGESDTCVRVDQVLKNNGNDIFMNLGRTFDNYTFTEKSI